MPAKYPDLIFPTVQTQKCGAQLLLRKQHEANSIGEKSHARKRGRGSRPTSELHQCS